MPWLEPKLDWASEDYYNPEDLNRVENNTTELAQLIQQLMGVKINLENTITDRNYSTIEFADSLNRVERNLQKLSVLNLLGLQPLKTNWRVGDPFNFKDAIRLENNLSILYGVLSKNINTVAYCGTYACGEEVI